MSVYISLNLVILTRVFTKYYIREQRRINKKTVCKYKKIQQYIANQCKRRKGIDELTLKRAFKAS